MHTYLCIASLCYIIRWQFLVADSSSAVPYHTSKSSTYEAQDATVQQVLPWEDGRGPSNTSNTSPCFLLFPIHQVKPPHIFLAHAWVTHHYFAWFQGAGSWERVHDLKEVNKV